MGYFKNKSNIGTAMHLITRESEFKVELSGYKNKAEINPEIIRIAKNIENRKKLNNEPISWESIMYRAYKLYALSKSGKLKQDAKNKAYYAHVEMIEKKFPIKSPIEKFNMRYNKSK